MDKKRIDLYRGKDQLFVDVTAAGFSQEASVIVAWPTSNGGPLKGAKVLDLTRFYTGLVSTLIRALLGAEVTRIDEHRPGDLVRFSTAFCMWLHIGGPPL